MHRFPTSIVIVGLLAAIGVAAEPASQPAEANRATIKKIGRDAKAPPKPTGPLVPVVEQLIPPETLAKDATGSCLILHHNDIHDGAKPRGGKLGGIAYIGGYIKAVRARRPDTIVLNAGDNIQNSHGGDYMGLGSQGETSFRELGISGCDMTVMGDHDFAFGLNKLQENLKLAGVPMITAGVKYQDTGELVFPEYLIRQVGDVKVGIIGATRKFSYGVTKGERRIAGLEPAALFKHVDELARKIEPQVDLTVVVFHEGTYGSELLANAAPMVDVVVCGHDNEVTQTPMKSDTGALIVNQGGHGNYMGSLDLVIDKTQKKIAKYTYETIPIDTKKLTADPEIKKQIAEWDAKWGQKPAKQPTSADAGD